MILVSPSSFVGQYKLARSNADDVIIQSYIDREETKTLYRLLGKELADLLIANIALTKTTTTSGLLVVGVSYKINTYVAGDDFTNVGGVNTSGTYFVATGTTPTTWTNLSSLTSNKVERYDNILNPFYLDDESWCGWWEDWYSLHPAQSHGILDLLLIQIYSEYLAGEQIINSQSGVISQSVENGTVQSPIQAFRKGEQKWNNAGLDTWYAIHWYCKYKYPLIYPEFKGVMEQPRYSSFL